MALDPVCSMQVENESTEKYITHKETKYHFCSTFCMELFSKNPEKYITNKIENLSQIPKLQQSLNLR
jgi:YHS domain-containing protein